MTWIRWFSLLGLLLGSSPRAEACSVPVFRYALERWKASPYEVLVYHRGKLAGQDKKQVTALEHAALR